MELRGVLNCSMLAVVCACVSIWPSQHTGIRRGDTWAYHPLKIPGRAASDLVPFHKLSQWLTLSMLEPIEHLGVTFVDMHLLTGSYPPACMCWLMFSLSCSVDDYQVWLSTAMVACSSTLVC